MNNFVLFLNAWMSYLLVFFVFIAVMIVGGVCGVKWRKHKDAQVLQEEKQDAG